MEGEAFYDVADFWLYFGGAHARLINPLPVTKPPANVHSKRERLQDETETSALAGMTLIASMSTVWWNSGGSGEIHFAR